VSRRSIAIAALVAAAVVLFILTLPITITPHIKRRLLDAVGERFDSHVAVDELTVTALPRVRVHGRGLVLRQAKRPNGPPLITIATFSADASLFAFLRDPLRLGEVRLDGLEINVPPGGIDLPDKDEASATEAPAAAASTEANGDEPGKSPLIVARLVSERASLRLLRNAPGKSPRVFEIQHLAMEDVGANHPWPFRAELTNPTPPGEIKTEGTFGPWDTAHPQATPLSASYDFQNADLGVFDGIQGALGSTGKFSGVLERIEVTGEARVPAFALSDVGNIVPLQTTFHSIVDGTSGDTLLQPVDALLLTSHILAAGGVVEREGEEGRTVTLDVRMDDARVEDVLRLAVKGSRPGMTGQLKVATKFVLPPGKRDVIEKLRLEGTFAVEEARFTTQTVQSKVDEFSTKARGVPDDSPPPVVSNFKGRFAMRDGVIRFSDVAFSMPGARVNVAGAYVMATEALDFRGTVRLDARLSSFTTGFKKVLVRLIDGLFRHEDITVIPIIIGGTAEQPKVRLDFGRVLRRN
jgi:hypothetical protein